MKRNLFIIILALALLPVTASDTQAQRKGERVVSSSSRLTIRPDARIVTRDVRVTGNFHEILSRGIADVEYRQSNGVGSKIEIVGPQNLVEYVSVENSRGILEIGMTRNISIRGSANLKVVISGPGVSKMSTIGSGDLRLTGPYQAQKFELSIQGSGDVRFDRIKCSNLVLMVRGSGDIDGNSVESGTVDLSLTGSGDVEIPRIDARDVEVTLSGSGDIEIGGRADNATYKLRGSGDIDADRFYAAGVNATLSGSGDISCYAEQNFRCSASGSGTVTFGGHPRNVDVRGNKRLVRQR